MGAKSYGRILGTIYFGRVLWMLVIHQQWVADWMLPKKR